MATGDPPGAPQGPREAGRLRRWILARRAGGQQRSYRIANSIRLPWGIGVVSFLLIAIFGGLLVGRQPDVPTEVPGSVLDYQEGLTVEIAQSIRRGVNEGVNDIEVLAGAVVTLLEAGARVSEAPVEALFAGFSGVHGRYRAIALVDGSGRSLVEVGGVPHLDEVDRDLPADDPRVLDARRADDDAVVIPISAPVPNSDLTVFAEYDPMFLRFPLEPADPGDAWILNEQGRIVATQAGTGDLTELPRQVLREQAAKAVSGASGVDVLGGSIDELEVIAYSPVSGVGTTGALGWSVVTTRTVRSLPTPATDARRQAVLFALLLAIMTLTVFGWLWIVVIQPIVGLQREAERVAYGDLTKPVKVERYDEIGLLGRAIERMRVLLIRRQAGRARRKASAPPDGQDRRG